MDGQTLGLRDGTTDGQTVGRTELHDNARGSQGAPGGRVPREGVSRWSHGSGVLAQLHEEEMRGPVQSLAGRDRGGDVPRLPPPDDGVEVINSTAVEALAPEMYGLEKAPEDVEAEED